MIFYFSGNSYKKTTRRQFRSACAASVDKSVSSLLIALRLMIIAENQIVDIWPVGLLGNSDLSHCPCTSFTYYSMH